MLEGVDILTMESERTAYIHIAVPPGEIRNVMRPGLTELREAVAAQGIEVTGPWFTHHLKMSPEMFDFEICVPVLGEVTAVGRVQPGSVPEQTVAQTVYRGSYEYLGAAWSNFMDWIADSGHQTAEDLYERYITGPDETPISDDWRTELSKPILH